MEHLQIGFILEPRGSHFERRKVLKPDKIDFLFPICSASLVFPDSMKREPFDRSQQVDSKRLISELDDFLFFPEIPFCQRKALESKCLESPDHPDTVLCAGLYENIDIFRISRLSIEGDGIGADDAIADAMFVE
ncbi:MAG: hypothetical protein ABSF88_07510 [Candidatus Aminicenantales bacterium]